MIFVVALALCSLTVNGATIDDISTKLQSLTFLHEGTIHATDNITTFTQCNGFSESGHLWNTNDPRMYPYLVLPNSSTYTAPSMGMRSSVPLGGLGTGSVELRGDGSFADWMLENQGTALAADKDRNSKIPLKEEAFLGVYFDGVAKVLRTTPPTELADAGVPSLSYSGAFPFSRLRFNVKEKQIDQAQVYAYSPFKLHDSVGSNIPAIAFSLVVTNPFPTSKNVSFMLSLPLGSSKNTDRPRGAGPKGSNCKNCDLRQQIIETSSSPSMNASYCLTKCAERHECTWWVLRQNRTNTSSPFPSCELLRGSPAVERYIYPTPSASVTSGVKGVWDTTEGGGALQHLRRNSYDYSPNATWQDPASAIADYTLLAADHSSSPSAHQFKKSVTYSNDLRKLWNDFAQDGQFEGKSTAEKMEAHGAVASMTTLAPGETRSITIVFSWYLPYRLYVGQEVGNFYTTHLNSSLEAARNVASRIGTIIDDAAAWNTVATNTTLPETFSDYFVNTLATQVKMGIWVRKGVDGNPIPGGRYRQFEAYSNCDLDPVHVSSYHMLPYGFLWPDLAANTLLTGWASEQLSNGMIQEFLGDFGTSEGRITAPMDSSAGGRTMADTTTVFILYAHLVYKNTGDDNFLQTIYPFLTKAAEWQMNRTLSGIEGIFPSYLQNTYDYLGLDQYPAQAYTGFLHLAAMRSMQQLSLVMGDQATNSAAKANEALVRQGMEKLLWVTNQSFWRAYQNTNANASDLPMSGTFHGQSWAFVLGHGALYPQDQLLNHLSSELKINCGYDTTGNCEYGLRPFPPSGGWGTHGSPSMNMDHAATKVWLDGFDPQNSHVKPALSVMELYRSKLMDLWNWHDLHVGSDGLSCSGAQISGQGLAGTPFVNAHYARQLQGWAIALGLVKQHYDGREGGSLELTIQIHGESNSLVRHPVITPKFIATVSHVKGSEIVVVDVIQGEVNLSSLRVQVVASSSIWIGELKKVKKSSKETFQINMLS